MIDDDQSWDLVVRIPGYVHRPPALKPRNSATGGALHRLPFTRSFFQFFRLPRQKPAHTVRAAARSSVLNSSEKTKLPVVAPGFSCDRPKEPEPPVARERPASVDWWRCGVGGAAASSGPPRVATWKTVVLGKKTELSFRPHAAVQKKNSFLTHPAPRAFVFSC